ncbi:MAG TPA: PfkB family carbohydrate kinase, partial [Clostridiales bacterium]|nr:PfkB family carbohydrate kinase [Clostridiales bacterium]
QPFELIGQLKSKGVKLAIDVEADSFIDRNDAEAYIALTDVLFLNQRAFDKYCGAQHYAETLEDLLSVGPRIVVVTRGADGCLVKTSKQEFTSPAYDVKVIDTTGAGDTFNSTFLYGILSGWDECKSAQFANGAAALAIAEIGPRGGVRPIVEIEDFIRKNTLSKE